MCRDRQKIEARLGMDLPYIILSAKRLQNRSRIGPLPNMVNSDVLFETLIRAGSNYHLISDVIDLYGTTKQDTSIIGL